MCVLSIVKNCSHFNMVRTSHMACCFLADISDLGLEVYMQYAVEEENTRTVELI